MRILRIILGFALSPLASGVLQIFVLDSFGGFRIIIISYPFAFILRIPGFFIAVYLGWLSLRAGFWAVLASAYSSGFSLLWKGSMITRSRLFLAFLSLQPTARLLPDYSLQRHRYREAGGGFKIEEPLPHVPDTTLVKYALLDALTYQQPYGSCFRAFFRSEVEKAILGRTSFVVPVEFAEWMVGVAAIRIDKPEVGLSENRPRRARPCGANNVSTEFSAR
ncbi:hypothetical protein BLA27_07060 [Brucella cytisi]|uniref:Uncharacterized protein n=1 Tax=Brucella cytisi TaxID=407152 RepID=A0A1J6I8W9_9HYPH|nr:hypothetical protein BLA27_07060 [Brucella cytisi]